MKKHKINNQRLSRIIMSKDTELAKVDMLQIYGSFTLKQREEIKQMFIKNASILLEHTKK